MEVILITGASSGLGKEFAYKYAKNRYNLLLVARNEKKLNEIKNDIENKYDVKVFVLKKDLSESNSAKYIFDYTAINNLVVTILINNAGFGDYGNFLNSNLEHQTKMINLNVITLVELTHYYLKEMIARNSGKILNISSIAGFMPGPKMSVYYATKSFVLSFTEALSEETKNYNVKISALCPGPTKTDFEKNATVNFSSVKMQSSKEVIDYCYGKFMNSDKVIILPSFNTKFFAVATKLLPRFLVRKIVYKIQTKFRSN